MERLLSSSIAAPKGLLRVSHGGFNAGVQVAGLLIVFDPDRVGYHYVNLIVKSQDGRLRT